MELNGEFYFIIFLLIFLSISIYYSIKLLRLTEVLFSYSIIEKRYVGIFRVLFMGLVIIFIVNVYLSLVFSLRLELISAKLRIYFLLIVFFILRIITNLYFKLRTYDKIKNFKEVWALDFYSLDKFVFWNIFSSINAISFLGNIKLILLMNWWVLVIVVVLF